MNKNVVNRTSEGIFLEGTAAHYEASRRPDIKNCEIGMLAPGYFGGSGAGIISEERAIAPFTPSIRLAQHTPDPERPSREVHTHSHAFREQLTRLVGADAACE